MKLSLPREDLHRKVYLFGLALLVCCLPLSRYLLSISQFLLLLNWILEGKFRVKLARIAHNPSIWLVAAVSVIYAISLLYTRNVEMGLIRTKNTLTLVLLAVVMGTSAALSGKQVKQLLLLFSGAVMTAAVVCLVNYFIQDIPSTGDFRNISVFMLHARFALMVIMAIFALLYLVFYERLKSTGPEKAYAFTAACLLVAFLFFLRSFSGVLIFLIMSVVFIANSAARMRNRIPRHAIITALAAAFLVLLTTVAYTWFRNFHARPVSLSELESFTSGGNRYTHDLHTGALENGHYIDIYVCEPELAREWKRISSIPYDSTDRRGQEIRITIRRYLASKALRKDSSALHQLNSADIEKIENGLANCRFQENPGVYQRLYETLWEIHILMKSGYVLKHSLGQRYAFLLAAGEVIRKNIWTGVGIGDVYGAMLQVAQEEMPELDPQWEGKPHNQFLFFTLAFGLPGLLCILFCFLYPVYKTKAYRLLLFNLFAGTIFLSMLSLDTLESYYSMVFFAFFYCLFTLGTDYSLN